MIEIKSFAQLGKSLSVKREKDADDDSIVACHLKFEDLFVDRDVFDELCRQPIGWHEHFYDEQGAPVGALEISLPGRAWSVTGSINAGPNRPERLNLLEATLSKVTLTLRKLGVLVGGAISWRARGDEVEDLADFLGTLAAVEWRVSDGEQRDLLGGVRAAVGNLQRMANRDGTTLTMTTGDGQELLRIEPRAGV